MKLKNTLIIPNNTCGYDRAIIEAYEKLHGESLKVLDLQNVRYKYPNKLARIKNFFYKTFLKRNLKKEGLAKLFYKEIQGLKEEGQVVVLRPDLLSEAHFKILDVKFEHKVGVLWDSVLRFPKMIPAARHFDRVLSFEPEDRARYGYEPIDNFFFDFQPSEELSGQYDVFSVLSYDKRFPLIKQVVDQLDDFGFSYHILLSSNHKAVKDSRFKQIRRPIPIHEIYPLIYRSKAMLDIRQPGQKGLSMRSFEAFSMKKKIITNNKTICDYDFFHEENVLFIDDTGEILDVEKMKEPFRAIPEEIMYKYSAESWVKKVFS